MATSTPNTGARSRAPRSSAAPPIEDVRTQVVEVLSTNQADASAVDALVLGIEVMFMQLRDMLTEAQIKPYLLESELWTATTALLEIVREKARRISETGEHLEILLTAAGDV